MNSAPKIYIENGAFKKASGYVRRLSDTFVIVTDQNLKDKGEDLRADLLKEKKKCHLLILPAGETTKSLSMMEKVVASMLRLKVKRDACLIGLGGGVMGDLSGFVASIYMRGITYVSIPTTLLAMSDSSIGGKTGIDVPEGKNLLGTFYHPEMIIMDPLLLKSLSDRAFRGGLAEIVKHGIIRDRSLFTFIEKNASAILSRRPEILKKIISKSVSIKMSIVKSDEKESMKKAKKGIGSRMLLNYGHTVGHALEQISDYKIPHGDAVAIGMIAENRIAVAKKMLKESEAARIYELFRELGLPTKIPSQYSSADLKKAIGMDKKHIGGKLYFALPMGIGKSRVLSL